MKKMKLNNLNYFNFSKNNPELLLDKNYIFTDQHPEINKYQENLKQIKDILITINTLKNNSENEEIIFKYYQKLQKNLTKYSNTSEFSCFVNACDNSLDSVKNDLETLKIITDEYFKNRILNENAPIEWIQALIDNNSSRKKGKNGEKKLIKILNDFKFINCSDWKEFTSQKKSVISFSNKINIEFIRKKLNIELETNTQNKSLDLIIKFNDKFFLCEAKHINGLGGLQNKQIAELIKLTSLQEKNKNVFYISFLDGKYSNILLSNDENKGNRINTQIGEITNNLSNNQNNFCLNTKGFKKLFEDLNNNNY